MSPRKRIEELMREIRRSAEEALRFDVKDGPLEYALQEILMFSQMVDDRLKMPDP